MGSGPGDVLFVDKPACRALADGLGTAGQELQVLGKGGAVVGSLDNGLTGAKTPDAYHVATRTADKAMSTVGTALLELGGVIVGAVSSFHDQDTANAGGITGSGGGGR
ncbi:hypothetical protein [Nocardia sp. NPDC051570]|uniref:hypothetical protein n=1 Tax=Nocardia sp. NPDC051570 TaxID=3364324 RepID=UPI0037A9803E